MRTEQIVLRRRERHAGSIPAASIDPLITVSRAGRAGFRDDPSRGGNRQIPLPVAVAGSGKEEGDARSGLASMRGRARVFAR